MRQTLEATITPPKRFFWQGNHWQICAVQRFWIEALPWWRTASPSELVAASLAQGASQLALTDRDGLYGAVKFATACQKAGKGLRRDPHPHSGINPKVPPSPSAELIDSQFFAQAFHMSFGAHPVFR